MAVADYREQLEDLIAKIATENGVAVGRDDPILIVATMLRELAAQSASAQEEALQGFQSSLEEAMARWDEGHKLRVERTLTAAVTASMGRVQEIAEEAGEAIRRETQVVLKEQQGMVRQAQRLAWVSLATSAVVVAAALALAVVLLV